MAFMPHRSLSQVAVLVQSRSSPESLARMATTNWRAAPPGAMEPPSSLYLPSKYLTSRAWPKDAITSPSSLNSMRKFLSFIGILDGGFVPFPGDTEDGHTRFHGEPAAPGTAGQCLEFQQRLVRLAELQPKVSALNPQGSLPWSRTTRLWHCGVSESPIVAAAHGQRLSQ
jgi:hypothetical protein